MTPSRRSLTVSVFLALALSACVTQAPPPARVDGVDITEAELETAAGVISSLTGIQQIPCGQVADEGDSEEAACNRFSLGTLVQFELASAYAAANGVTVDATEISSVIEEFEGAVGESDFAVELESNGVTHEDFEGFVRASLLQDEVARAITRDQVGEDGLRQLYEERELDYTVIEVDHILLASEEDAWDVYEKVTAKGATRDDFLKLASEVSQDPSVEDNSGMMPATPASQFVPEFSEAAVALEPGEISEPVRTDYGWHVIHMVSKDVAPFERVQDAILDEQMTTVFSDWVRERAAEGIIEVDPKFGRFDAELMTVVRITSTDPSVTEAPASGPVNAAPEG